MIVLLQAVLGILAAYHLAIGLVAVTSLPATSRVVAALYGARLQDDPQLRHAVRMLGFYALAMGALLSVAAVSPEQNRPIVIVAAALQASRAAGRLALRRDLGAAFQISPSRNGIAIALLLLETVVLVTGLLVLEP